MIVIKYTVQLIDGCIGILTKQGKIAHSLQFAAQQAPFHVERVGTLIDL